MQIAEEIVYARELPQEVGCEIVAGHFLCDVLQGFLEFVFLIADLFDGPAIIQGSVYEYHHVHHLTGYGHLSSFLPLLVCVN